jgi:hypothetical protein
VSPSPIKKISPQNINREPLLYKTKRFTIFPARNNNQSALHKPFRQPQLVIFLSQLSILLSQLVIFLPQYSILVSQLFTFLSQLLTFLSQVFTFLSQVSILLPQLFILLTAEVILPNRRTKIVFNEAKPRKYAKQH